MHIFIPKLSKSHLIFLMYIFDEFFISFFRRHWYRKKRFDIPICFFIVLIMAGIILGSVLGTRVKHMPARTIFDISQFKIDR
jgi:hypothetical protein